MDNQDLYRALRRIRRTEEEICRLYSSDVVKSPVHLSIGQEFVSVGVCAALRADDVAFGTYRSHALYLAKGGDLETMWAELYGKATGFAAGRAGSMHLAAWEHGMIGTSAIVATSLPNAAGYALMEKMRGTDRVVVVFFGDGAVDEGVFHETLNFASLKALPILFVCENNFYAIYSPVKDRLASGGYVDRAAGYGVRGVKLDDGRVDSVVSATGDALRRIRSGAGPRFLEVDCYRWMDHVGHTDDAHLAYRDSDEIALWKARDELPRLAGELDADLVARINEEVERELKSAVAAADAAPFPTAEDGTRNVYAS